MWLHLFLTCILGGSVRSVCAPWVYRNRRRTGRFITYSLNKRLSGH